jgi:hypothetical protein
VILLRKKNRYEHKPPPKQEKNFNPKTAKSSDFIDGNSVLKFCQVLIQSTLEKLGERDVRQTI